MYFQSKARHLPLSFQTCGLHSNICDPSRLWTEEAEQVKFSSVAPAGLKELNLERAGVCSEAVEARPQRKQQKTAQMKGRV